MAQGETIFMKIIITVISLLFIGLWFALCAVLLGFVTVEPVSLGLPKSAAELGDAFGILNGLFSSLAVVLALVAVFLRGRELRASTKAQEEQARSLQTQLEHQRDIMRIQLLQVEAQYRSTEIIRMDSIIENVSGKPEKKELFDNAVNKKREHISALNYIQSKMANLQ